MSVATAPPPPAYLWTPTGARGTYGEDVAGFMELAGRPLDASQRVAVDCLAAYGPGGAWQAFEAAVIEGRQNGKTGGIVLPITLTDLFLWADAADRIIWTAHLFRTSRDAFLDSIGLIDGCDELRQRVRKVSAAHGEESIELTTGARLEFLARSAGGGRGLGGKRLVLDEALFLRADAMGALLPTLAARQNTQVIYASSAAKLESDHLRSLVERGRAGGDASLAYVEWCAPGSWGDPPCAAGADCSHLPATPGCALDDEAAWLVANPGITAGRIRLETMRSMRRAMDPLEFGREFMGWHEYPVVVGEVVPALDLRKWAACQYPTSAPVGPIGIGVEVAPDRSRTVIGIAGVNAAGRPHLEVAKTLRGTIGAVDELERMCRAYDAPLALSTSTPTGSLLTELERRRVPVLTPNVPQFAAVCGRIWDDVDRGRLAHRGQPELTRAVEQAPKRETTEGAWRWDRRGVDITELCAVTLGVFAQATTATGEPGVWEF